MVLRVEGDVDLIVVDSGGISVIGILWMLLMRSDVGI